MTIHFKIPGRVPRLSNGIPDISVEDLKIGTEDISFCIIVSATALKLSESLTWRKTCKTIREKKLLLYISDKRIKKICDFQKFSTPANKVDLNYQALSLAERISTMNGRTQSECSSNHNDIGM